ncbi:MAG: FMN-binding protein [Candidatus Omnitrophota bacterium]
MRMLRKGVVVSLSLSAFLFMLPFELMQGVIKRLSGRGRGTRLVSEVYAEVFCQVDEALQILLPTAKDIKEEIKTLTEEQKKTVAQKAKIEWDAENDRQYPFYVSSTGIAVINTVKGKWGPITFMMAFDKEGKIKDLIVLELKERRGRPVKDRRFLDQFMGKSAADPIKLNKDIKGIAGATISSRQMSDGIRKLVHIYELFYKQ